MEIIDFKNDGYRFIGAVTVTTTFLDPFCCRKSCCAKINSEEVYRVKLKIEKEDDFYEEVDFYIEKKKFEYSDGVKDEIENIIKEIQPISVKIEKIKKIGVNHCEN